MKYTYLKTFSVMLATSALLGLSGCGGPTGEKSDSQLVGTAVVGTPPVAVAVINPSTVTIGDTVSVDGSGSYDPDGSIVSYIWSYKGIVLGEGATADVSSGSLAAGTYIITLTVIDNDGNRASTTAEVTLVEPLNTQSCLEREGYGTVTLANGQIWLDKNLGATQVATETNDTLAYGDLYQWGRAGDGHEKRDSNSRQVLAATIVPGHPDFIITSQLVSTKSTQVLNAIAPPQNSDWVDLGVDDNGSLRYIGWKSVGSETQVCPCGYVVPSATDFDDLNQTDRDALALTYGGFRTGDSSIIAVNDAGFYWTRNVYEIILDGPTTYLPLIYITDAEFNGIDQFFAQEDGSTVRCINPSTSKENIYQPQLF